MLAFICRKGRPFRSAQLVYINHNNIYLQPCLDDRIVTWSLDNENFTENEKKFICIHNQGLSCTANDWIIRMSKFVLRSVELPHIYVRIMEINTDHRLNKFKFPVRKNYPYQIALTRDSWFEYKFKFESDSHRRLTDRILTGNYRIDYNKSITYYINPNWLQ